MNRNKKKNPFKEKAFLKEKVQKHPFSVQSQLAGFSSHFSPFTVSKSTPGTVEFIL